MTRTAAVPSRFCGGFKRSAVGGFAVPRRNGWFEPFPSLLATGPLQNDSLPTPRRILLVLLADLTDSPPSDRHLMGADWMWTSPKCTRLSEHKW